MLAAILPDLEQAKTVCDSQGQECFASRGRLGSHGEHSQGGDRRRDDENRHFGAFADCLEKARERDHGIHSAILFGGGMEAWSAPPPPEQTSEDAA